MTAPGLRGTTVVEYGQLLENYTPTLAGTWFGPGQTADKGQAFAFMGLSGGGAGYVLLAIATQNGITAYPDSSDGPNFFGVDNNGWLVVGPSSNNPVQLRQNSNSNTGHIDNFDLNIANITVGYDAAWNGGTDFHLTFNGGGVNVHLTEGMDLNGVQTAIRAAFSDDRIQCYTDDFTRAFNVVGPADIILTGEPGITGDTTGQNVALFNLFHYKGWPAPFASTFHVMGAALSEGHLFIRDSNTPTNDDNPTDYLRGWAELAVTRFFTESDVPTGLSMGQTDSTINLTTNIYGRFYRQGLNFGDLSVDARIISDTDSSNSGAVAVGINDILDYLLPGNSPRIISWPGMVQGTWAAENSFANVAANQTGWVITDDGTHFQLVDATLQPLTTEISNAQVIRFSFNCLISNA